MKAWIDNNAVRDLCPGNPDELYHPDIAALYDTEVPEGTKQGVTLIEGVWTNPVIPEPVAPEPVVPVPPKLTPVQFKMCFTPQERIAIKAARATDPVLQDAYEILDDLRLTEVDLTLASVQGLIDYLGTLNLLTAERIEQVKMGVVL